MEFEQEVSEAPVSPTGQYLNSSVLSISIIAVLETEIPIYIDDSLTMSLLKDVFLPINPRFSSIMVGEKNGVQKWRRVEVKLEDHVNVPIFPHGESPEFYDDYLNEYISKIGMDEFPQSRPLWEIHIIKYPTSNAAGNIIFKLHHALGDGFSLMGALLSCLQRADDPSLPLTFPSRQSNRKLEGDYNIFRRLPRMFSGVMNTVLDFGWSILKSSLVEDDRTPIRSGDDGVEFKPIATTTMAFSLDHIKQIKANLHEVTINDVIVGIIFFGTRLYMQETSHELSNSQSTALVLLNTRAIGGYKSVNEMLKTDAEMPWGNQFAFLHVPIPSLTNAEYQDPLKFVLAAHQLIKRKRNSAAVYLTATLLETLRKFRGPEATARFIHSTLRNSSMTITNMIGPVERMALANHPVRGIYFGGAGAPHGLTVSVVSYVGTLRVCLGMEKGFMDPHKFKSCIQNAFEMIKAAVVSSASPANY